MADLEAAVRDALRADIGPLIEAALADGRQRLQAWLTDLVVAAGQQVVAEELGSKAAPDGRWYVYGITTGSREAAVVDALRGVPGIGGHTTETASAGALIAVVSPVAGAIDDAAIPAAIRAHEDVLERMLAVAPVVPLRFGTALASRQAAADLLEAGRAQFEAALGDVGGAAEWAVTISWDPARASAVGPGDAVRDGVGAGSAYLRSQRDRLAAREAGERRRSELAGVLHDEITSHARAGVRLPAPGPEVLLRAAYLVSREDEAGFAAWLEERLDRDASTWGWSGEVSGPWPPYHFVAVEAVAG